MPDFKLSLTAKPPKPKAKKLGQRVVVVSDVRIINQPSSSINIRGPAARWWTWRLWEHPPDEGIGNPTRV